MSNRSIKFSFVAEGAIRVPTKIHTARETEQLLEDLRSAYQSLGTEGQCTVKCFMSELWESQRRFGRMVKRHTELDMTAGKEENIDCAIGLWSDEFLNGIKDDEQN